MTEEPPYTVEEAAHLLRVTPESVRRWLRSGQLRGMRLSRQAGWRIPRREIERTLAEGLRVRPEGKATAAHRERAAA